MGYNLTTIGRIGIAHQTTWGTPTTAAASFTALECEASLPPVGREVFERAAITSGHHALAPIEGSQHGQEYTLTFPIHGFSSSLPTGDPTVSASGTIAHPEAQILKSCLGGVYTAGYLASSTKAAVSDSKTITIDNAVDSDITGNFGCGQAVAVRMTPTGESSTEYRGSFVVDIDATGSDDFMNLTNKLGGTIAAGETTYGSKTTFITTEISPDFYSLEWRSLDGSSRVILDSCVVKSVELTLDPRGVPMMSATFIINGITSSTESTLGNVDFSLPHLPTCIGSNSARFLLGDTATDINNLSVKVECELSPRLSHSATNGVSGLLCTKRTCSIAFSELLTSAPALTLDTSIGALLCQIGSTPGNMMLIGMPLPVEMELGALADADGLVARERSFYAGNNTADGSTTVGTPDPADSDFRIAFI